MLVVAQGLSAVPAHRVVLPRSGRQPRRGESPRPAPGRGELRSVANAGAQHPVDEPPPVDLHALADDCASAIIGLGCRRPVLAGKSFGGLFGYVVCQALESRDFEVGRFVPVVSGHPSLWKMDAFYAKTRGNSPQEHALWRLTSDEQRGAWPPQKIDDEALLEQARRHAVIDFSLGLQPISRRRIITPITEVSAKDDEVVPKFAPPGRWAKYTTGEFTRILVTGGHYFYWANPQALATILTHEAELALSGSFS